MTPPSAVPGSAGVEAERRGLLALAYRMLGTVAEAEDAVQETYVRWYRLDDAERAAIENPAAWLTRVAGRVCLDELGSARARREVYAGQWLPEPLPSGYFGPVTAEAEAGAAGADPLDRVTLDEAVSSALLVVLESMTPAERVAFVLHDVFAVPFDEIAGVVGRSPAATRQLASSARRRVRAERTRVVPRREHDDVVRAFGDACRRGDLAALMTVLDPSVTLRSDGGGVVSAARNAVVGADRVGRFLLGIVEKNPQASIDELETADGAAYAIRVDGEITGVVNLGVAGGRVADVWIMLNPAKLLRFR